MACQPVYSTVIFVALSSLSNSVVSISLSDLRQAIHVEKAKWSMSLSSAIVLGSG